MNATAGINRVLDMIRDGDHNEALLTFPSLIQNPDTRSDALGHRAWLFRSLGRYEDALQDYGALLNEAPDNLEAATYHAEMLLRTGQAQEALTALLKVLDRNPLHPFASTILLQAQRALGVVESRPSLGFPDSKTTSDPSIDPVVDTLDNDPNTFPTSVGPDVGRLIHALVRSCRPAIVVETGCHIGYSSLCIARGLDDNGIGHLHSFDLFDPKPNYVSPVVGARSNTLEIARAHAEKAGLSGRVTFHKGDSSSKILEMFGEGAPCVDLAFIDGDHTINGCLKDWLAVDGVLKDGGIVLLHDTEPNHCHWLGPRWLMEELSTRADSSYQQVNLPTPEGFGFAILRKKKTDATRRWRPALKDLLAERLFHLRD